MKKNIYLLCQRLGVIGLVAVLSACSTFGEQEEERSGVGVHSLNYTGKELSYIAVEDPKNPDNSGGGDALNPYGGGNSTVCCFGIPSKWRPDLQAIVKYRFYPENDTRRVLVSVPPYADGKPGNIWIMVHEGGQAEAVVSNYGPSRPEWPGRVKGYPVPSREYELKLWGERLQREKAELVIFEKALKQEELTSQQRADMEKALDYTRKTIKHLEGNKP